MDLSAFDKMEEGLCIFFLCVLYYVHLHSI